LSEKYTGFRVYEVAANVIEDLRCDDKIPIWDKRYSLYPNTYLELKDKDDSKNTTICKIDRTGSWIQKIESPTAAGIQPRNREQAFALHALMDDSIPIVILTGIAGSGKTLLALAAAMEKINLKKYSKIMITRPMSYVGKYSLGALPGDVNEKFSPYLLNYTTNMELLVGKSKVQDLIDQFKFEVVPLQLIRGASFNDTLVIADEIQILNHMEVLTIGTRIGENSKIVLMGDLNQRDEKIARDKTGIYKLMNDSKIKNSPLAASIELQRCERSATARLFSEVFGE